MTLLWFFLYSSKNVYSFSMSCVSMGGEGHFIFNVIQMIIGNLLEVFDGI